MLPAGLIAHQFLRAGRELTAQEVVDGGQLPGLRASRPAGEQAACVRVLRVRKESLHRSLLHHLAPVHHQHLVGHLAHHSQVVRDEQHAHAVLLLELLQQRKDIPLHEHIECGGGFVTDQHFRAAAQGQRDHHALFLATTELVRIAIVKGFRVGQTHFVEELHNLLASLPSPDAQVFPHGLGHLVAHAVHGVQRGHRFLEHHGQVAPAVPAEPLRVQVGQLHRAVVAGEPDGALHDGVAGKQSHQRQGGHALARA